MGADETEASFDATASESGAVVNHEGKKPLKKSKLLLAVLYFGTFLGISDEFFVLTTSRQIAESFHKGSSGSWLFVGYNLGYSMALPIYGRLYEVLGQRKTFLLAYAFYGLGCIVSGTPHEFYAIVAGRFLVGAGASGMLDLASVALNGILLPFYLQTLDLTFFIHGRYCDCAVSGGPLGAILAGTIGWRWSFLVHIPFVAVCAIIVFFKLGPKNNQPVIETSSDEESNIEKTEEMPEAPRPPLDILGIITLSCAILCFVILVEMLEDLDTVKRHIGLIVGLGVGFIVFTATFIFIEVFWAKNPVIPLHLLKTTQVGLIWGTTFFMQMGNYSFVASIAPYFARMHGLTTIETGLCLGPAAVGAAIGSVLTGMLVKKSGKHRVWAIVGLSTALMSFTLILPRWSLFEQKMWELFYSFFFSWGLGMTLSAQFVGLSASTPEQYAATSITSYYLFQQAGTMIGITMTTVLQHLVFKEKLEATIGDSPESLKKIEHILESVEYSQSLPEPLRKTVNVLFRESYMVLLLFVIATVALSLLLVLRQKNIAI
ncbi:uncharacterized protein N7458_009337 [Penicillium daleae]|uniref:Major facilitator superfamily (MFS) profile domain-containing protein n=1 Tax=Penicillium daleae TaxID=63821 RepID=A0AAD6BZI3_9EURO|nr:uncharacterized protein N7458_009337 [Penicillium daleae]KAJ5438339.1 hypothetical protein N7458_009337 [Penicillium daleae]